MYGILLYTYSFHYTFHIYTVFIFIECQDAYSLDLLCKLLYPRGFGKNVIFIKNYEVSITFLISSNKVVKYTYLYMFQTDIDVDAEISSVQQSAPFIATVGNPDESNFQVFICAEHEVLLESKTLRDSLIDLISTYFVFDISYPKLLAAVFLFFQHHIFNLKDKQTVPNATNVLVRNLKNY